MERVELFAFPSFQSLFVPALFLSAIDPNSHVSRRHFAAVTVWGGTRIAERNPDRKLPTVHCVFRTLQMNQIPERAALHMMPLRHKY